MQQMTIKNRVVSLDLYRICLLRLSLVLFIINRPSDDSIGSSGSLRPQVVLVGRSFQTTCCFHLFSTCCFLWTVAYLFFSLSLDLFCSFEGLSLLSVHRNASRCINTICSLSRKTLLWQRSKGSLIHICACR